MNWKVIRIFLWLKVKEIAKAVAIFAAMIATAIIIGWPLYFCAKSPNVWLCFIPIYLVASLFSLFLFAGFCGFVSMTKDWLKDNWRKANEIAERS